jgi:hypothetical protein
MTYVVIWARRPGTCELWLNGGGRIGNVTRDARSFGLLDQDGRLVVDREQRHGNQLFVNAFGPLASSHRDTLALPSLELMCRALRSGFALDTSDRETVARVVTIDRKRCQTTALASIKTCLPPIAAAVTLLHLCALLGLPCAPAASS